MKVYLLRPLKKGFKLDYERVGIVDGKSVFLDEEQFNSNMYIESFIKSNFIDVEVIEIEQPQVQSKPSSPAKKRSTKKSVVTHKEESESRIVEEDSKITDLSDATDESKE